MASTFADGWRSAAACRGRPTSLWYSTDQLEQAIAVAVCRSCPVRQPCLDAGVAESGVWGAMTEDDRRRLARRTA